MSSSTFEFGDERVRMPRPLAIEIEKLLVQNTMCGKMEKIYSIIRAEVPTYQHKDNSNARKMLTARNIKGVIRKLPVTAILQIVDVLEIARGRYMQGIQPELFESLRKIKQDKIQTVKAKKSGSKKVKQVTAPSKPTRKQLEIF